MDRHRRRANKLRQTGIFAVLYHRGDATSRGEISSFQTKLKHVVSFLSEINPLYFFQPIATDWFFKYQINILILIIFRYIFHNFE